VAVISLHTSPLLQPGSGDSGGMNVYVREIVSSLAQAGVECTTYTRADREGCRRGARRARAPVVHIEAGPHHLPKEALPDVVDEFTDGCSITSPRRRRRRRARQLLAERRGRGHRIKHELDIPFVATFHTLARVKAEGGDPEPGWRDRAEAEIVNCADAICVSCTEEERSSGACTATRRAASRSSPRGRARVLRSRRPTRRHGRARPAPRRPVLLFVGRIQPLKGPDVAIRALHALDRPDAQLVIVGGASGADGDGEVERAHQLVDELGLHDRCGSCPRSRTTSCRPTTGPPTWCRAEPQRELRPGRARGRRLWGAGGGERRRRAAHARRPRRDRVPRPRSRSRGFAAAIARILDDPLAASMSVAAGRAGERYTWGFAAARLRRLYTDLTVRQLVLGE
jgi:D-inositol-3-phosphate glycosyltransferase